MQYLRFRKQTGPPDWKTGEVVTSPFGLHHDFGCSIVDEDVVHVFGTMKPRVSHFSSASLHPQSTWKEDVAIELPTHMPPFNTAVGKGRLPDGACDCRCPDCCLSPTGRLDWEHIEWVLMMAGLSYVLIGDSMVCINRY